MLGEPTREGRRITADDKERTTREAMGGEEAKGVDLSHDLRK
jgi:hypothetical protein